MDGLGRLKSNSVVKAVVAVDQAYAGWSLTDEILRMATKTAPVAEPFPSRLFTAQNIGSIQVTTAAQASGAWFGDTSYQSRLREALGRLIRAPQGLSRNRARGARFLRVPPCGQG